MDLEQAREAIKAIDEQMALLFVERMEAAREIAEFKRAHGMPVEDVEQEARVFEGRTALIQDAQLLPYYVRFLQATIDASKRWQHHVIDGKSEENGQDPGASR